MGGIQRFLLGSGALCGLLAVAFGAFGSHALKGELSDSALDLYRTAVQYHFWHALGLCAIGLALAHQPQSRSLRWAGILMLAGIIVFCGSLYALALTGARAWGMLTPIGGTSWLLAWALFAWGIVRPSRP